MSAWGWLPSRTLKRNGITIETQHVYPPIPDRSHDWSAAQAGYDVGDHIGWGPTEEEAVADLLLLLEDA